MTLELIKTQIMLTIPEVQKHASFESCWVIIDGNVYDVTTFLDSHPGGADIILKYAGRDATAAFAPIHPSDTIQKYLDPQCNMGPITPKSSSQREASKAVIQTTNSQPPTVWSNSKPVKLSSFISISDFEKAAAQVLPARAFAFFKTGAEDEYALRWNRDCWKYVRFRPRGLRPVEKVDTSCEIMGNNFSVPFFICPAGGGKLANPAGEVLMTKAAGKHGMLHWVCNGAGCTQEELMSAKTVDQTLYWQIYVKADLKISEKEILNAVALGYKGFALTVDSIRPGKREQDMRTSQAEEEHANDGNHDGDENETHEREPTVKRPPVWSSFDWPSAIDWMRSLTDLPIAIKGIQCWEDAVLCMQFGVHPWISNHGGRQLDSAPSAIDVLVELRRHSPDVLERCEVIVDGGIERGADIVKAIALGAKGVGLGRAFLYSLVFGEAGVSKAVRILRHEVETTMALLGVQSLKELDPSYVDVSGVHYGASFARLKL